MIIEAYTIHLNFNYRKKFMKIKTVALFILLTFLISTDAYSICTTAYWNNSQKSHDRAIKTGKEALRKCGNICNYTLQPTTYDEACRFYINKAIDLEDNTEYIITARKKLNRAIDRWEHLMKACDYDNRGIAGKNRRNIVNYYNEWENVVDDAQRCADKIIEQIECKCSGDLVVWAVSDGEFSKEQLKYMPEKVMKLAEDYKTFQKEVKKREKSELLFDEGESLIIDKDYEGAKKLFEEAVALNPDINYRVQLKLKLIEKKIQQESRWKYLEKSRADLKEKVLNLINKGEYNEGLVILNDRIKDYKGSGDDWIFLEARAYIYLSQEKWQKSIQDYQTLFYNRQKRNEHICYNLGLAYFNTKEYEKAIEVLYYYLGNTGYKDTSAILICVEAYSLLGDNKRAEAFTAVLADAYARNKQFDKAVEVQKKLIAFAKSNNASQKSMNVYQKNLILYENNKPANEVWVEGE